MFTSELDYDLPDERIAQRPLAERDGARMLVCGEPLEDAWVRDFPERVPPGALVVLNDSRVMQARLLGNRVRTGGRVEILLLEPEAEGGDGTGGKQRWQALVRSSGRLAEGTEVRVGSRVLRIAERGEAGTRWVEVPGNAWELLEREGHVPLPPYVRRPDDTHDRERYQTVFARHLGSAAAPTAGLHVTQPMLARLEARGVDLGFVTLHVGAGTFRPVTAERLDQHAMHSECYTVSDALARRVAESKRGGRPIVAVGTTVVRALESAALAHEAEGEAPGTGIASGTRRTRLMVAPGYQFRVVDALLTNFHAPRSTLLALVCALAGTSRVLGAYAEAVRRGYRFLSYGDAMWIPQRS